MQDGETCPKTLLFFFIFALGDNSGTEIRHFSFNWTALFIPVVDNEGLLIICLTLKTQISYTPNPWFVTNNFPFKSQHIQRGERQRGQASQKWMKEEKCGGKNEANQTRREMLI